MSNIRLYTKLDDVKCDGILLEKSMSVASLEDRVINSWITSQASLNSLYDLKSETTEFNFSVKSW